MLLGFWGDSLITCTGRRLSHTILPLEYIAELNLIICLSLSSRLDYVTM